MQVTRFSTTAFNDQNPGTSGLRKKTVVFSQPNYTENFIQSIFDYLTNSHQLKSKPFVLVVGGDGRYLCSEITKTIIQMAAANHVSKVIVGQHSLFSTPAVSHIIRKYKAQGGIILTASHNPGGLKGDFGIKFNTYNGGDFCVGVNCLIRLGSAVEQTTKAIFELSTKIESYKKCALLEANIDTIGSNKFSIIHEDGQTEDFIVEVINSLDDYVQYVKEIFDFAKLRQFIQKGPNGSGLRAKIDCLNGITGPYVVAIMKELGADLSNLDNIIPKPDFGGLHPDPNLTYAAALVESMKRDSSIDIGAAFDGDGDRYMVLGKNAFFVNPSDCVAIVAANAVECIPYFRRQNTLKGVARSMPTSGALENVASQLNIPFYMTPTGWKFFGNLMDAGKLSICGEESFGLGSDHIREKDGIWAFLCILSIMSNKNKPLDEIVQAHWQEFGRNFYLRYDYEELELGVANQIYEHLREFINSKPLEKEIEPNFVVEMVDDFGYTDPVDGSTSSNQVEVSLAST